MAPTERIGIALSGGGHRATLFALGALTYLVDAEKNRDVDFLSSVSGGSIASAYLAQAIDFSEASRRDFEAPAKALASRIAHKGTVFAAPLTWFYLLSLVITLSVAVSIPWWLNATQGVRILVTVLVILLWASFLLGLRGHVCSAALRRTLYSPDGKPTRLKDLRDRKTLHVFCATELQTGNAAYFSPHFIYSYSFGTSSPGDLPLHRAVQLSANFPFVFPPRWLSLRGLEFATQYDAFDAPKGRRHMVLSDGGVYNNLGTQWAHSIVSPQLADRLGVMGEKIERVNELIIVDASAPPKTSPLRRRLLPILGELLSAGRVINILYNTALTSERRSVIGVGAVTGGLVLVQQNPFRVPEAFRYGSDEKAERAVAALNLLANGPSRVAWELIARSNARIPTVLFKIRPDRSSSLLYQGYVLAMVNLHVIFGYPLLPMPDRARFDALVAM